MQKKEKTMSNKELQEALISNFVNLQKVLTNLSIKFDALSENIARLLQIFEISAKSFVKKQETMGNIPEDKELLNKLDTLMEQNKTIAKGLTLVEEKIRHKIYPEHSNQIKFNPLLNSSRFSEKKQENSEEHIKAKPLPRI